MEAAKAAAGKSRPRAAASAAVAPPPSTVRRETRGNCSGRRAPPGASLPVMVSNLSGLRRRRTWSWRR
ncbi:hypothetical protein D7006_20125 [Xanthobacter sp. YC-JY1]|nr:hypothetical protein D7006_20125 [Xanthobacter sp. YC-JY1]